MRGYQITFRAGGSSYTGQVKGNVIEGNAQTSAGSVAWTARRAEK
jgi:hypothetical protein